jgi:hypothetical protein
VVLVRRFAVLGEFDALCALPAPEVGRHGLVLEVARQMVMIGLDGNGFANEPRRHGIRVAIKTNGEIGMDFGLSRITAIRDQRW